MSFDYSKLATLKPKLIPGNKADTDSTGVPSEPLGEVEPKSAQSSPTYLDATHTLSEQKIYSVMYRAERERHWGFLELSRLTGIRSDTTIRRAIDGLIAKLSIEVTAYQNGNRLGPRYRVFT